MKCAMNCGFINKILDFAKIKYIPIPLTLNRRLPTWLDVEIEAGVIHFYAAPNNLDVGEILIQIIQGKDRIIKEFWINVQEANQRKIINQNYKFGIANVKKLFEKEDFIKEETDIVRPNNSEFES